MYKYAFAYLILGEYNMYNFSARWYLSNPIGQEIWFRFAFSVTQDTVSFSLVEGYLGHLLSCVRSRFLSKNMLLLASNRNFWLSEDQLAGLAISLTSAWGIRRILSFLLFRFPWVFRRFGGYIISSLLSRLFLFVLVVGAASPCLRSRPLLV